MRSLAILALPAIVMLAAPIAPPARADPMISGPIDYATSFGTPGPTASGPPVIHFEPLAGTLTAGSPFLLGDFVIDPSHGSVDSVYNHTPFSIELDLPQLDRSTLLPAGPGGSYSGSDRLINAVQVQGYLDGVVTAAGSSNVVATLDAVTPGSSGPFIPEDVLHFTFPFPLSAVTTAGHLDLTSDSPDGGRFGLSAEILSVPEPTPLALLLTALAVGKIRLRRRGRRDASGHALASEGSTGDH
jgi:hypothetical protein